VTRLRATVAGAAATILIAMACGRPAAPTAAAPQAPAGVTPANPNQRFNDSVVQAYLTRLGARRADSAGKIFENLQLMNLRGVSAQTFLGIMNGGYARALGVSCAHCHDLTDFASDAKRPKLAAREMAAMHRMINQELAKMQHIQTPATQNRAINCATCHRGQVIPR
jgi:hypothetical protein